MLRRPQNEESRSASSTRVLFGFFSGSRSRGHRRRRLLFRLVVVVPVFFALPLCGNVVLVFLADLPSISLKL